MIDFALEAEREQGKSPDEAIYQACLLRFRPIMMTTMAALLGGVPLAFGSGHGRRASPAARHHDRRRPDPVADPHALHHAGGLSLLRSARASGAAGGGAARGGARAGAGGLMNISEPFIRRPVATSLLSVALLLAGAARVPDAAGGAAAAGRVPGHPGPGPAARGEPGDDGLLGGHAARAPVRAHRRRHRDDVDQPARGHDDRAAVRPRPEHRRRRARRAGRHQRRPQPAAAQPAEQPELSQDQPGRRAHPDPGHDLRRAAGRARVRRRRLDRGPEALAGGGRGSGVRRRRRAPGGARPGRSQSSRAARDRAGAGAGRARRRDREPAQGRAVRSPPRPGVSAPTRSSSTPISTGR